MTERPPCPRCGTPLPDDAPAGLCPKCLVQAGFESDVEPQPTASGSGGGSGSGPAFQPTRKSPVSSGAGFEPPPLEELVPLFPQLEIGELLGKGGMGAVYKARQRGLDRFVALKILPPEIGHDAAFAERFSREARALARLSHNHIVSVYDFGQVERLFYIVMEYVDGVNLRQTMQAGGLTPQAALAIVPQICEALQFAHDEGIVHRDIKPENILIDKKGQVKIADFGLAKMLEHDASDPSLTATHQVMGTLRYMAPEQMQGSRQVDHRADIYSLGVVFYEMLTGELPLGRFPLPSQKVQVDVRLDEVVLRALDSEPRRRYQHAEDVKTDIDKITSSATATETCPAGNSTRDPAAETVLSTVRDEVRAPAIGLIATGIIHCAVGAAALILMLIAVAPELIFKEQGGFPRWALLIAAPVALSLIVGWLMISGGLKMLRLKSYGSAVAASVAAILPCGPIGVLGMVVGIWALITLNRSQVRAAFSSAKANAAGQAGARGFQQAHVRRLSTGALIGLSIALLALCLMAPFLVYFFWQEKAASSPIAPENASIINLNEGRVTQRLIPRGMEPVHQVGEASPLSPSSNFKLGAAQPLIDYVEQAQIQQRSQTPLKGVTPQVDVGFDSKKQGLVALIGGDLCRWDQQRATVEVVPVSELVPNARIARLAPAADCLLVVGREGGIELRTFAPGDPTWRLPIQQVWVAAVAPDKRLVAVYDRSGTLALWDGPSGKIVRTIPVGSEIKSLCFSSDQLVLAAGCENGTIQLWQADTAEPVAMIKNLPGAPNAVAFSPDGARLAVACGDGAVHVYFVATGRKEARLTASTGPESVAFSPDGQSLAAGTSGEVIQTWSVPDRRPGAPRPTDRPPQLRLIRSGFVPRKSKAPEGLFSDVAIDGSRAYLSGEHLSVVDLSNPLEPRIVGECRLPSRGETVAVAGPLACVLDDAEHLRVVDVSDSSAPKVVGSCHLGEYLKDIAIQGRYAYVVDHFNLRIIDLENPAAPREVGRLPAPASYETGYEAIAVSGQLACLAADLEGLQLVDISDPTGPKETGVFRESGNAERVTLSGRYAYVTGGEDAVALRIVDISNPAAPRTVGKFGDWITGGGVAIAGDLAFLLGGELDMIDISSPVEPRMVGAYNAPGDADPIVGWRVAIAGQNVCVLGESGLSVLHIIGQLDTKPSSRPEQAPRSSGRHPLSRCVVRTCREVLALPELRFACSGLRYWIPSFGSGPKMPPSSSFTVWPAPSATSRDLVAERLAHDRRPTVPTDVLSKISRHPCREILGKDVRRSASPQLREVCIWMPWSH